MIFPGARLKKADISIPIILNNTDLEQVTFTKFLDVITDDKLTFERHIVYTKKKISKGLGIIIKTRKYLNRESLLKLYNSYVFPYLTYCVEPWGTSASLEVRGTADVGWRSLFPLPFDPPRTHSRLYHHMCLRTDGQ